MELDVEQPGPMHEKPTAHYLSDELKELVLPGPHTSTEVCAPSRMIEADPKKNYTSGLEQA